MRLLRPDDARRVRDEMARPYASPGRNRAPTDLSHVPTRVGARRRRMHAEALANAVIGLAIAQIVLLAFSVPLSHAIPLNLVMFAASYARSFVIRIIFKRISAHDDSR